MPISLWCNWRLRSDDRKSSWPFVHNIYWNVSTWDINIPRDVWSSTLHQVSYVQKCGHKCFPRLPVVYSVGLFNVGLFIYIYCFLQNVFFLQVGTWNGIQGLEFRRKVEEKNNNTNLNRTLRVTTIMVRLKVTYHFIARLFSETCWAPTETSDIVGSHLHYNV